MTRFNAQVSLSDELERHLLNQAMAEQMRLRPWLALKNLFNFVFKR